MGWLCSNPMRQKVPNSCALPAIVLNSSLPLGNSLIGRTSDSGSDGWGSSPCSPALP